jgi:hypothetical protein
MLIIIELFQYIKYNEFEVHHNARCKKNKQLVHLFIHKPEYLMQILK